jgi:2-polyprenyl-3-methyl-5-hydroxy-6-metoxy-1,4-benzoquinol methylase
MKKSDKNKVYEAYDEITDWFDKHRSKDLSKEKFYLEYIEKTISPGGSILDVGCGTGEPIAKYFIEKGYQVTGIDASEKMIALCKERFPQSHWILNDMRTLNLREQFNIVIAWHSLFHLPHADQQRTLKLLASFVKLEGLLVFTSGPEYLEHWSQNGNYDLYHASLSGEEYTKILKDNNLKVLIHKIKDPNCGDATVWIAQKH